MKAQLDLFGGNNSDINLIDTAISHFNSQDKINGIIGLRLIPDFISPLEEKLLVDKINQSPWLTDIKRRVQHYGWKYDYKARSIDYSMYLGKLPEWIELYAKRLHDENLIFETPDQIIVNEYKPGQGIANHVDCEPCFGETIISLSLNSAAIMDFINLKTKEKVEILLPPRSLVVIADEARHRWSHGISARKTDYIGDIKLERQLRISLTFRNVILDR